MNKPEDVQTQAFAPAYDIREKQIKINLEAGESKRDRTLSCSVEAYNKFLKIIANSLDFDKKEELDLKWDEATEEHSVTFSWSEYYEVTSIPKRSTIPEIINEIVKAWSNENDLEESTTQSWKHAEDLKYMKMLWINKLFKRLIKAWDPKLNYEKKGYGSIIEKVGKELNKYMPTIQKIGSVNAVIGEGEICEDPKLILGLIVSNPEEFFIFKDCEAHGDMMPWIYYQDLVTDMSDTYYGVDIVWESKTRRLDGWIASGIESAFISHDEEEQYDWRLPFDCHDINKEETLYKELDVRSWIVDERTFTKKRRLVAKKFVFERTGDEKIVTTCIREIGWKDEITDENKIELLKTIFGSVNTSEEKYRPLSNREIPFSDKGIEFIVKKLIGAKENDYSKENLVKSRVDKHRLGSKLIEIGQLLEWWDDLGELFYTVFSTHNEATSKKMADLPLRVLGSGIRKVFDMEYDHPERDVVTKEA